MVASGVETAVKRLQEDQEPATRGQEVPIGSLGQSLPETKQGYAKNVGNGIYEVGQVQESDEAKTLGQQQLRERVAGDDIANPSSQLAASTSKTTVELMEVPGNAVAPKFQDLSVHGESQQASVEQSMSEDHLDYLNAVNDQAKTVPRVSDGVKKLTPETEIQRVPSPSSASKTLQPVEVCACPEGWR